MNKIEEVYKIRRYDNKDCKLGEWKVTYESGYIDNKKSAEKMLRMYGDGCAVGEDVTYYDRRWNRDKTEVTFQSLEGRAIKFELVACSLIIPE